MKTLLDWSLLEQSDSGITLLVEGRHWLRVEVLDEQLFRVSLLKDGAWRLDRSWAVAPDGDMPWAGRKRGARKIPLLGRLGIAPGLYQPGYD